MGSVIYLPFVGSVLLVALGAAVCRHTRPRRAVWTLAIAALIVAAAFDAALALLAWPLIARIPFVAHMGRWHPNAVDRVPVPVVVSGVAIAAALLVAYRIVDLARRLQRDACDVRELHDSLASVRGDVVVVDQTAPVAFALAGTINHRGRVVISTGILNALDDQERAAVLAHETAHLRERHRWFAVLIQLAHALNPLLWPLRADVNYALERWADDRAATRTSPTIAARALAKSALASLDTVHDRSVLAVMHIGRLGVPQRIDALLDPPRPKRSAWLVTAVAVACVAAVGWAAHDTERIFEALRPH